MITKGGQFLAMEKIDTTVEKMRILPMVKGEIPGAAADQCGNWQEQNLNMAKYYIKR